MFTVKYPAWLLLLICLSFQAWSAATDNLWLCPDPSGVDNLVSATAAPASNCQPYSAERLKAKTTGQNTTPTVSPTQSTTVVPPVINDSKGSLTVATAPPEGILPTIPSLPDFSTTDYADMTATPGIWHPDRSSVQSNSNAPLYKADATKIYSCTVNGEQQIIEDRHPPYETCLLMGAKGGDAASLTAEPSASSQPSTSKPSTTVTNTTAKNTASSDAKIYLCRSSDGSESILQADAPPSSDCQLMGVTGESTTDTSVAKQGNQKTTATMQNVPSQPSTADIATTESDPGDIYKCYDDSGRPSFVNEKEISGYRRCQFFSRSFTGVKKLLRNQASAMPLPEDRAIGNRLICSGAGQVVYNGETRAYECATRSYDYSPGSTGGEIRLGDQYANIAAYDQDYLGTSGSCGGTITSANGRVLHLEPTKDCPEAVKIEARRIAQAVRAGLNINVSGAFRERQRGLSPQINRIANEVGVDVYLVHAVISAESAYKSRAVSHAGARGLMQLMPATAKRFGVSDSFHTGQNIRGGATYLKWLLNKFNGNMELAVAGYNAGEGNVIKYGYKIPPFIETKAYVPKVMQYYRRYRSDPSLIGL